MTSTKIQIFEAERKSLLSIAYRMLGEISLAEDIVQDVWIKWNDQEHDAIHTPAAWLRTTTTRLAIDILKSAKSRREIYVGPWLPEPLISTPSGDTPEDAFSLARDCELALLWAMERLNPDERAAFILRNVFDADYTDIASTLGKTEENCRKIVSRASKRVKEHTPKFSVNPEERSEMLVKFSQACVAGDFEAVKSLLAPDVIAVTDGGGKVSAALRILDNASDVATVTTTVASKLSPDVSFELLYANGSPAFSILEKSENDMVMTLTLNEDGLINWIYVMRNPDKLPHY